MERASNAYSAVTLRYRHKHREFPLRFSPPGKVEVGRICYPCGVLLRVVLDYVLLQLSLPTRGACVHPSRKRGVCLTGGSRGQRQFTRMGRGGHPAWKRGGWRANSGTIDCRHGVARRAINKYSVCANVRTWLWRSVHCCGGRTSGLASGVQH